MIDVASFPMIDAIKPYLLIGFDILLAILAFYGRRRGVLEPRHIERMTQFLLNIVYPSLIFSTLTRQFRIDELKQAWDLPLYLVVLMSLGFLLGTLLTRSPQFTRWGESEKRSLVFMTAMPNYVFLPLLITQSFWSTEATAYLILASFGGDLFLWLVMIPILGGRANIHWLIRKPPILALLLALITILIDRDSVFTTLAPLNHWFQIIGRLTVPLSMVILGSHLGSASMTWSHFRSQAFLTSFRLVLTPAVVLSALLVIKPDPLKAKVIFLIATMPTAIASVILAKLFRGDPQYCAQQIFISHLFAFITVPLWLLFVNFI